MIFLRKQTNNTCYAKFDNFKQRDMDFGNDFTESYDEKSRKYVDDLDFQKLAEIRSKALRDLTDADFGMK